MAGWDPRRAHINDDPPPGGRTGGRGLWRFPLITVQEVIASCDVHLDVAERKTIDGAPGRAERDVRSN